MSSSEEDSYTMIYTSLKHPIRRKILRILSSQPQTFSDLQKQFKIESSHLTYHIDGLGNLLYKTEDGKYALSSLGEGAVSTMKNVEEPPATSHLPFTPARSSTHENKLASRATAIALGIVSIVLAATLVGAFAYYVPTVNSKDSTISSLNSQVSNLQTQTASYSVMMASLQSQIDSLRSQIAQLEDRASSDNVTIAELNSTVASLNAKITSLTNELNQLETWVLNEILALLNQTQTPVMAQGSALGFQLTMTLEKTVFRLGEPIKVTLTITNITNETMVFCLGPENDLDFHVYNETNSDVYWRSSMWLGSAIPQYLVGIVLNSTQPWGNSWTKSFLWQQNTISVTSYFNFSSAPVSPGTYYIVGRVGAPYFEDRNSIWQTTPIQITILPF